jgi:ribA/ribD-fused uncharacterized protein
MDPDSDLPPDAVLIARIDPYELLGSYSPHAFTLDERTWSSAEHYAQATKFPPGEHFERIHAAPDPSTAARLGRAWFRRRRRGWRASLVTYMTRAIYTKCHTRPEGREHLLATGERPIIDCTWDPYWGCSRDGRGYNHYGRLLERVRSKLREEAAAG